MGVSTKGQMAADYNNQPYYAPVEGGDILTKLFPNRISAVATSFILAASFTGLSMTALNVKAAEKVQRHLYETSQLDTTGWPACKGRELPWRHNCVMPK